MSGPFGRYVLCVLAILSGLVCLSITASGSFDTAITWASTSRGEAIYGAGSLFVDVVVIALFSCFVGALLRGKNYLTATGLVLFVLCGMLYSGLTFYQFGIKERVTKTEMAEKTYAAQLSADAETKVKKDVVLNRLLDDMQGETESIGALLLAKQANVNRDIAKSEIQALRNKKADVAFSNIEVKPAPVFIDPDPGARGLAADTGLSVAGVQRALMLFLGTLLICAKPICFALGVGLWPKSPDPVESVAKEEIEDDLSEADNDPEPKALIHTPKLAVDPLIQVRQFYEEATEPSYEGAKPITATDLHMYYQHWIQSKNYWPNLNLHNFGRASAELIRKGLVKDMVRKPGVRGVNYHGRLPINFEDREVA